MCFWCECYEIIKRSVGPRPSILLCRCETCSRHNRRNLPCVCKACTAAAVTGGRRCYELRAIYVITEQNKYCRAIIREMAVVWVRTCYDFVFMPKPYVNKLYFHSEFVKQIRKHFGYNVRMSLHRAPIVQAVAFIRCVQRYNSIALADALEGVFERMFTDVMLSEKDFPILVMMKWYNTTSAMISHGFHNLPSYTHI